MSAFRISFVASAVLALIVLAGCESSTPSASSSSSTMPPAERAIAISTNTGTTTIFVPTADPEKPVMLCAAGAEVCPECKAAAIKYFQTGVLDPKCSRTGATRTVVSSLGHQ